MTSTIGRSVAPQPTAAKNRGGTSKGRDYSDDEREFIVAVDRWRRQNRRRFPACTEMLDIAVALGYRKVAERGPLPAPRPSIP